MVMGYFSPYSWEKHFFLVFEEKPDGTRKSNPVSRSASSTSERVRAGNASSAAPPSGGALNLGFKKSELEEEGLLALVVDADSQLPKSECDNQLGSQFNLDNSQHFEMSAVNTWILFYFIFFNRSVFNETLEAIIVF